MTKQREIRFRVWDKQKQAFWFIKNGLMLNLFGDWTLGINTKQGIYPIPDTGQPDLGIDRYVVEQLMDLYDRDNTPVFENDILEYEQKPFMGGSESEAWMEAALPLTRVRVVAKWYQQPPLSSPANGFKVVGNVHEHNPLLEEQS